VFRALHPTADIGAVALVRFVRPRVGSALRAGFLAVVQEWRLALATGPAALPCRTTGERVVALAVCVRRRISARTVALTRQLGDHLAVVAVIGAFRRNLGVLVAGDRRDVCAVVVLWPALPLFAGPKRPKVLTPTLTATLTAT
jgi:hypothetical protein